MERRSVAITVRPYQPGDERVVAEVHYAAVHGLAGEHYPADLLDEWSVPVTDERVARQEAHRSTSAEILFLADVEGEVVAFSGLDPASGEVTAVYVRPEFARASVGTKLLAAVEKHAQELELDALWLEASLNAVPFYASRGYRRDQEGSHRLWTGRMMPMVRMSKRL